MRGLLWHEVRGEAEGTRGGRNRKPREAEVGTEEVRARLEEMGRRGPQPDLGLSELQHLSPLPLRSLGAAGSSGGHPERGVGIFSHGLARSVTSHHEEVRESAGDVLGGTANVEAPAAGADSERPERSSLCHGVGGGPIHCPSPLSEPRPSF